MPKTFKNGLNSVNHWCFSAIFVWRISKQVVTLHRVFHGIDLRLTGLVVERQSILFFYTYHFSLSFIICTFADISIYTNLKEICLSFLQEF